MALPLHLFAPPAQPGRQGSLDPSLTRMTTWNAMLGALLQLQGADTVLVRQVEPSLFHRVADVAGGLVNIVLLLVVLALLPLVFVVVRLIRKLMVMLEEVKDQVQPLTVHATAIADNVNYISATVRSDVQRVSDTVNQANERVQAAIEAAEDRVRALHAVLDVMRTEAQETMISAAATMRGVRAGAAAFVRPDDHRLRDDQEDDDDGFEERKQLGRDAGPRIRRRPQRSDEG